MGSVRGTVLNGFMGRALGDQWPGIEQNPASGQWQQQAPLPDAKLAPAETVKKKKPKKNTLLTPASGGQTLSGGDMSIQRKNLLGS